MRKSRFSEVEAAVAVPLPLPRLLAFDFRLPEHSADAPVLAERARILAVSLPLLIAAHLLWCALLVFAYAAAGRTVPLAPAWLAASLLGLDLGLMRLLRRRDAQPHESMCVAAAHAALCGGLWIAAAVSLSGSGSLPIAAQFALIAGAGATLATFFFIPALAMLSCLAALGVAAALSLAPPCWGRAASPP